jgi:hypothetical protein
MFRFGWGMLMQSRTNFLTLAGFSAENFDARMRRRLGAGLRSGERPRGEYSEFDALLNRFAVNLQQNGKWHLVSAVQTAERLCPKILENWAAIVSTGKAIVEIGNQPAKEMILGGSCWLALNTLGPQGESLEHLDLCGSAEKIGDVIAESPAAIVNIHIGNLSLSMAMLLRAAETAKIELDPSFLRSNYEAPYLPTQPKGGWDDAIAKFNRESDEQSRGLGSTRSRVRAHGVRGGANKRGEP